MSQRNNSKLLVKDNLIGYKITVPMTDLNIFMIIIGTGNKIGHNYL